MLSLSIRRPMSALGRMVLLASSIMLLACRPTDQPPLEKTSALTSTSTSSNSEALDAVTIDICGQPVRYTSIPRRVVAHDVNLTEMLLYLGLGPTLVGHSGISAATKEIDPNFVAQLAAVPSLSKMGMNLEAMLDARTDFVVGGWGYGFREGQVTPARLTEYGVASYVLRESCIRVAPRREIPVTDALDDMRNLAAIFRIGDRATPQLDALQVRADSLAKKLLPVKERPKVFLYDSGTDIPTTSGRFGMPSAMIRAAGGENIFDDIANNWPRGNWEDVIARDPDWIVIVDYGRPNAQGKIDFLRNKPELAAVRAIQSQRFFVMSYAEATPGPRNVPVTERLAQALHPELFTAISSETP
ncbi:MAG: ABC transporter substrate-binding protein [Rhodoferax sp.]|nr:ABC transporter substrate-binding protein [Rhodoferax sp.]MBP9940826.1 ABC transporter substrate-binding protein [Comamonas sp.]